MLSSLARPLLGRPLITSLRSRALSSTATGNNGLPYASHAFVLLGRSPRLANATPSFVLGTRNFSVTPIASEPVKKTAKKPAAKKTTAKKKATKKAATKTTTATKKKPAKKAVKAKKKVVKAVKVKKRVAKKPVKKPRILVKDLTPPFPRPHSAWVKFSQEHYMKHRTPDKPFMGLYLPKAGEEWRKLSQEEKDAYKASAADWEIYQQRKKDWYAKLPSRVQRAYKKRHSMGPRNHPNPSFTQYVKENHKTTEYPDNVKTITEKMKHLASVYSSTVTEGEKEALRERAVTAFEAKKAAAASAST